MKQAVVVFSPLAPCAPGCHALSRASISNRSWYFRTLVHLRTAPFSPFTVVWCVSIGRPRQYRVEINLTMHPSIQPRAFSGTLFRRLSGRNEMKRGQRSSFSLYPHLPVNSHSSPFPILALPVWLAHSKSSFLLSASFPPPSPVLLHSPHPHARLD